MFNCPPPAGYPNSAVVARAFTVHRDREISRICQNHTSQRIDRIVGSHCSHSRLCRACYFVPPCLPFSARGHAAFRSVARGTRCFLITRCGTAALHRVLNMRAAGRETSGTRVNTDWGSSCLCCWRPTPAPAHEHGARPAQAPRRIFPSRPTHVQLVGASRLCGQAFAYSGRLGGGVGLMGARGSLLRAGLGRETIPCWLLRRASL